MQRDSVTGGKTGAMAYLFSSIPSPSSGTFEVFGLPLHMYGLMIAIGAYVAVAFTTARYKAHGGNPDHVFTVAIWAIPAGILGARMYHVATDWRSFRGDWWRVLRIWEGGLGIWGGVAIGTAVGVIVVKTIGADLPKFLAATAAALPLAQAIGRVGNWWNQELFGLPTTLPWGLQISVANRPAQYADSLTFHPTFLYEALWCLLIVGLVIAAERYFDVFDGRLFALYVALYTFGRYWIERLRVDEASMIGSFRINELVSIVVFVVAVACIVVPTLRARRRAKPPTEQAMGEWPTESGTDQPAESGIEQQLTQAAPQKKRFRRSAKSQPEPPGSGVTEQSIGDQP